MKATSITWRRTFPDSAPGSDGVAIFEGRVIGRVRQQDRAVAIDDELGADSRLRTGDEQAIAPQPEEGAPWRVAEMALKRPTMAALQSCSPMRADEDGS